MPTSKAKLKFKDPDFKMLFSMFFPIFVDMILNNFIGTVHGYFVADAGEDVLSAIGLVNQVNDLVSIVFFSACSATMIVVAQLHGIGKDSRAKLAVGQAITFTSFGTLLIALLFALFPKAVMGLFFGSMDKTILSHAYKYIPLLGFSLPFYCICQICCCSSRGFDNHKLPLVISVSGSIVNLILAYIFIRVFKLGIIGAGVSLIASRIFSAGCGIILLCRKKWIAPLKKSLMLRFSVLKGILYLGFFSSSEQIVTSFAGTFKTRFLAGFSTSHINASSIYSTLSGLLSVPCQVISTMITTLVAKNISKGETALAKRYFVKCSLYSFTLTAIVYLAAYLILPYIFPAYTDSPETLALLKYILIINAIASPTLTLVVTNLRAAFNGAGDARFPTIISIICMLILNLGFGYLFTVVFNWGIIGSTLSAHLSSLVKIIFFYTRYKRGKWVKKVLI